MATCLNQDSKGNCLRGMSNPNWCTTCSTTIGKQGRLAKVAAAAMPVSVQSGVSVPLGTKGVQYAYQKTNAVSYRAKKTTPCPMCSAPMEIGEIIHGVFKTYAFKPSTGVFRPVDIKGSVMFVCSSCARHWSDGYNGLNGLVASGKAKQMLVDDDEHEAVVSMVRDQAIKRARHDVAYVLKATTKNGSSGNYYMLVGSKNVSIIIPLEKRPDDSIRYRFMTLAAADGISMPGIGAGEKVYSLTVNNLLVMEAA